jgi:hypothetical protein
MRYSIMLQVVGIMTLILVATAGLFARLQNREIPPSELESKVSNNFYQARSNESSRISPSCASSLRTYRVLRIANNELRKIA